MEASKGIEAGLKAIFLRGFSSLATSSWLRVVRGLLQPTEGTGTGAHRRQSQPSPTSCTPTAYLSIVFMHPGGPFAAGENEQVCAATAHLPHRGGLSEGPRF